jgi:hypothetical protein
VLHIQQRPIFGRATEKNIFLLKTGLKFLANYVDIFARVAADGDVVGAVLSVIHIKVSIFRISPKKFSVNVLKIVRDFLKEFFLYFFSKHYTRKLIRH